MYEKEITEIRGKITEALRMKKDQMSEALALLDAQQEALAKLFSEDAAEYHSTMVTIEESRGDIYQRNRQIKGAAESYDRMGKHADVLYKKDHQKYDFFKAAALYKQAGCIRISINCMVMTPTPRVLNEQENKLYQLAMLRYTEACKVILNKTQLGMIPPREMTANCMMDMAVMHGIVGNYKDALECARKGVELDKDVYNARDDKEHSMRVALHMNLLALIYNLMKNVDMAMETLEDAIYALGEHEPEDPVQFGITIGRFQMNLANCYQASRTEKKQAEPTYLTALTNIQGVNEKTGGRFVLDLISAFQAVGRFYLSQNNRKEAESYLNNGILLADEAYAKNGQQLFHQLAEQMRGLVNKA